ncbi:hypothetical protein [Metaclostridioides mangenotii]|uniref:Uncharacterized protein n=1 Tax=Metaclostridioides mangenotii TaxID=1540 RepID=A0ABS4EC56_9FIRM|nr:hypothetical protein [Clostridioides mangenotii]MBP1855517.1 hypothetical protein [Clostridioides mangenotii]
MSKFLGPIHFLVYGKVQKEEDMVEQIIDLAKKNGWNLGLKEEVDKQVGIIERAPLDTVIDTDNIHAWLQVQVSLVESRFAYVVSKLLLDDKDRKDLLLKVMTELGRENAKEIENIESITPEDVYLTINKIFLDGMPCDRANEIIEKEEDKIVWRLRIDVHEDYWNHGVSVEVYHELRKAWLDGYIENSTIELEQLNANTYQLMRRR